jgi:hypothetical protein
MPVTGSRCGCLAVASGAILYEGVSPVLGILPFHGGALIAFTNCENRPELNRVHWQPDLTKPLRRGEIRYEGVSPVTAFSFAPNGF